MEGAPPPFPTFSSPPCPFIITISSPPPHRRAAFQALDDASRAAFVATAAELTAEKRPASAPKPRAPRGSGGARAATSRASNDDDDNEVEEEEEAGAEEEEGVAVEAVTGGGGGGRAVAPKPVFFPPPSAWGEDRASPVTCLLARLRGGALAARRGPTLAPTLEAPLSASLSSAISPSSSASAAAAPSHDAAMEAELAAAETAFRSAVASRKCALFSPSPSPIPSRFSRASLSSLQVRQRAGPGRPAGRLPAGLHAGADHAVRPRWPALRRRPGRGRRRRQGARRQEEHARPGGAFGGG